MPDTKYSIEVEFNGSWRWVTDVTHAWGRGYLAAKRETPGPRVSHRLVHRSGEIMDTVPAINEVGIGQVAGFPTAEQYERAGQRALERARLIREREARSS